MGEEIIIGMGEFQVTHNDNILSCLGLGSCIGITIYDETTGLVGMAHIMLPNSNECKNNEINKNKFADVAVPEMIKQLIAKGAKKENLKAKMAGGAHMFVEIKVKDSMNIGKRNTDAVTEILKNENIPIIAQETGSNLGRTIKIDLAQKKFTVKTKEGIKEI